MHINWRNGHIIHLNLYGFASSWGYDKFKRLYNSIIYSMSAYHYSFKYIWWANHLRCLKKLHNPYSLVEYKNETNKIVIIAGYPPHEQQKPETMTGLLCLNDLRRHPFVA